MAYVKKTWTDRQAEYPTRRKLTATGTADTYDVSREEGLIISEGDALNAANLNDLEDRIKSGIDERAAVSALAAATLTAAGWTGSIAPYSYTYSNAAITATHAVELLPGDGITAAQLDTLQKANIVGGTQASGSVALLAYGDKPAADLPVRFIIRGDL